MNIVSVRKEVLGWTCGNRVARRRATRAARRRRLQRLRKQRAARKQAKRKKGRPPDRDDRQAEIAVGAIDSAPVWAVGVLHS